MKPTSKKEVSIKRGNAMNLDSIFQMEGYKLLTQGELEESKAEESYERVLVLHPIKRQFFRKMIRFHDKYLRVQAF